MKTSNIPIFSCEHCGKIFFDSVECTEHERLCGKQSGLPMLKPGDICKDLKVGDSMIVEVVFSTPYGYTVRKGTAEYSRNRDELDLIYRREDVEKAIEYFKVKITSSYFAREVIGVGNSIKISKNENNPLMFYVGVDLDKILKMTAQGLL